MKAVVDRIVQYANRYQLTNVETGEVLGTFDFEEVTGTVQQVGTEIDKELFDSIANDLAARVKLLGGELAGTIVTFSDISGTAANVASGDTSATLWGKVKNWFSRLKALAFKNKVAAGDFEAGAIKNADVADDAAIAQSKVSGLMTDYVASISASGRTVTYKNKNGVNMGSITTQDTTYGLASQSSNGLMSSTDKTKLDGIESGAQKNTVLGVKGGSESAYRTGNVNITKANIGLGNVDNTSDEDKPVSKATQTALNGKANTSGTYPNLTVGKATNADKATNATNATNAANATKATQDANGNVIDETYATKTELVEATGTKVKVNGTTQPEVNFTSDPQTQITANKNEIAANENAIAKAQSDINNIIDGSQTVGKATQDADGNVINATYAKLSQVVRTDTVSSNTDEQKRIANENTLRYVTGTPNSVGWYRVAKLSNQGIYEINVSSSYSINAPVAIKFIVAVSTSSGYNTSITQIGGAPNLTIISQARLNEDNGNLYFEIYVANPNNPIGVSYKAVTSLGSGLSVSNITPVAFTNIANPSDVIAAINVVCGIATTGGVYQNGSPVLVGSAPSWVTGTSGSLTLPSAGWYIFGYNNHYTGVQYWDGSTTTVYPLAPFNSSSLYVYMEVIGYNSVLRWSTSSQGTVQYYKLA